MRIIFMRHAKTEPTNAGGDFARRLTDRGRRDAAAAGKALAKLDVEHAFVSSAVRTRQTFDHLGLDIPVTYIDDLYNTPEDEIFEILAEVHDVNPASAVVIGHVPSIQVCVWALAHLAGEMELMHEVGDAYPTSSFTAFDIDEEFQQLTFPPTGAKFVHRHRRPHE